MNRYLCAALAVLFVLVVGPAVAQATGDTTKVTWLWGATVSEWASAIGSIAVAGIMFLLRKLPAQVVAFLTTIRAEQLIQKSIDYGINAVKDAAKDKAMTVDVGNKVLAEALQYVIDNAPGWLTAWLGGPEEIAKKIWARLNLEPSASATDVQAIANRVAGT